MKDEYYKFLMNHAPDSFMCQQVCMGAVLMYI